MDSKTLSCQIMAGMRGDIRAGARDVALETG